MKKTIKVLCVSDEVDLFVYSSAIRERFGDIDLILSAGDLPAEYLGFISTMLNRPIVSVAGNHDAQDRALDGPIYHYHENADSIPGGTILPGRTSFSIRKEAGLTILGLPGCKWYNGGNNQYTDLWMSLRLLRMMPRLLLRRLFLGRGVDIVLAHAPPKGIQDAPDPCHQGFSAYRWLIKYCSPSLFIHGHVHLYDSQLQRTTKVGDTQVINVFGHQVINIELEDHR